MPTPLAVQDLDPDGAWAQLRRATAFTGLQRTAWYTTHSATISSVVAAVRAAVISAGVRARGQHLEGVWCALPGHDDRNAAVLAPALQATLYPKKRSMEANGDSGGSGAHFAHPVD